MADEVRMKQIMFNLVSNAVKYNKPNGKVVIKLENIDNQLKISVCDTGRGIKKEDYKYLFDKFTRLSNYDDIEGVGIGLHITRALVALNKGTIDFESTYGEGTCFWVLIDVV